MKKKSISFKNITDDGVTTYHGDGTKTTSYKNFTDDGVTHYHSDGSKSVTYKNLLDGSYTTYHYDGYSASFGMFDDAITIAVIGTVIALPFLVMLAMPQLFAFSLASIIAGILITFVTKDINLDFLTPLALPFFVYGLFSCTAGLFNTGNLMLTALMLLLSIVVLAVGGFGLYVWACEAQIFGKPWLPTLLAITFCVPGWFVAAGVFFKFDFRDSLRDWLLKAVWVITIVWMIAALIRWCGTLRKTQGWWIPLIIEPALYLIGVLPLLFLHTLISKVAYGHGFILLSILIPAVYATLTALAHFICRKYRLRNGFAVGILFPLCLSGLFHMLTTVSVNMPGGVISDILIKIGSSPLCQSISCFANDFIRINDYWIERIWRKVVSGYINFINAPVSPSHVSVMDYISFAIGFAIVLGCMAFTYHWSKKKRNKV